MLSRQIMQKLVSIIANAAQERGCSRAEIVKETLGFIKDVEESERDQRREEAEKLIIP